MKSNAVVLSNATEALKGRRRKLSDAMLAGETIIWNDDVIISIASMEGRVEALTLMSGCDTRAALMQSAIGMLARGADDSWSGRANDLKRAHHDGVRYVCDRVLSNLLFDGGIDSDNMEVF